MKSKNVLLPILILSLIGMTLIPSPGNAQVSDPKTFVRPIVKVEAGYSRTLVCTYAYTISKYETYSSESERTEELGNKLTYKLVTLPDEDGLAMVYVEGSYLIMQGDDVTANFYLPGSYFIYADWAGWEQFASNVSLDITTTNNSNFTQSTTVMKYYLKAINKEKTFEFIVYIYTEFGKADNSKEVSSFNATYIYDKATGSLVYSHEIKDTKEINNSVVRTRTYSNYEYKDLSYDFGNTEALSFKLYSFLLFLLPMLVIGILFRKRYYS